MVDEGEEEKGESLLISHCSHCMLLQIPVVDVNGGACSTASIAGDARDMYNMVV